MKLKKHSYKVWWHDGGMTVRREDGKQASFHKRREAAELENMSEREMFASLKPYKGHKNFA